MFFLLLLVGATVALPLQPQPAENLSDDVTEDAKRYWGTQFDYRLLGILQPAPNLTEILRNLTSKNQSLSDDETEDGKRMFVEDNLWDDILQFAAEIAPIVAGPIGKRTLDPEPLDKLNPPSIYSILIQTGLMPSKKDVEDNLWDDILQWAAEIAPIVNGPILPILGKRLLDVDYNPDFPNVDPAIISWLYSLINTRDA